MGVGLTQEKFFFMDACHAYNIIVICNSFTTVLYQSVYVVVPHINFSSYKPHNWSNL